MIDYMQMGKRVRSYREKKGWTQAELAFAVEMSNATISHIECGSGRPELNTVVNIANALDVTVDMLLCDSLEHAETPYRHELDEILSGCSVHELRMLCEIITPMLQYMRSGDFKNVHHLRGDRK